jgi:predicted nucleotidyltransferase
MPQHAPADALRRTLRRELHKRPEIVFAILHGSFVAGGSYRDVDVAVWLDQARVAREAWVRHALDLEVILEQAGSGPVDVRVLNDAPLAFRYHALKGEPVLVRDPELLAEMRARTWDDYFDFAPFARQNLREILAGRATSTSTRSARSRGTSATPAGNCTRSAGCQGTPSWLTGGA